MKKNILTLAFASLAILVAGSSCSKDFETVLNKELSTDTDISEYLPKVTRGSVNLGTFNLLISTKGGGTEYEWSTRKNVLAKAIVENDFDIFGVEEVDNTIGKELPDLVRNAAPDGSTRNYKWWIVRRDSQAADKGEGLGIVYDANRFTLSDQHYFWLNEKDPDTMNYGWDETGYHRMACCAVVTETATGKQFFMMVTHMPLAATARQGAAALINAREAMYNTGKLPAFLVGDMNATPDDPATATFQSGKWNDSYEKVPVASRVGQVITFHSQKAITDMTSAENRIDYVYYKNLSKVLTYKVDYNTYNGYYPSDHCPVSVTFDLPEVTPPTPPAGGIKGSGSEADPFQIATVEDWNTVAESINNGGAYAANAHYLITADLLFAGNFTRISLFNGTLNGNNHSLKNITGEADQAKFGGIINILDDGGVVKNLYVEATLSSAYANLGGVIGAANAGSLIDGVTFKGDLTGTGDAARLGGIVGTGYSVIVNCGCLGGKFEAGSATKSENIGGIAGRIEQPTAMMFNCYSFLDKIVSSNNNLGGVTGGLGTDAYCANVYGTTTDITGGGTYCGCIGYSKSGNIRNVYTSEEAAFNGGSTKWVANDKQASDWMTAGTSISLANMKSGAVALPSSGVSYDNFVAALNAGIEDWNALENIAAKKGAGVEPYGIVNKPDVVLRKWVVDPASGYPVVSADEAVDPVSGGIKGSGSESDPFQIASVADWTTVANSINNGGAYAADACYKLTADLLFAGDFTRISNFTGTLDGAGHSMRNITGEADQAKFGGIINILDDGGVVKNLYVEATLSSAYANLGGVIGAANAGSLIDGVTFKGDLTGTGEAARLGGIVGTGYSVIVNCGCLGGKFEAGSATKSENIGGIAGRIEQPTAMMFNCYSFLDKIVSSNNNLGGVTGGLGTDAYCANVYGTTTDITGGGTYCGCIGYSKSGNIRNVYGPEEAAFNGNSNKWVANDKQASDWKTAGTSISLANMKSGAVALPSSGVSYDNFVAALNAGIEDWNALENIAAKKGAGVEPYGIVNKPDVVLRKWVVDPATGYPVVSNEAGSSEGGDEPAQSTIVEVEFATYGPDNNWEDSKSYKEFTVGGVTFTASWNEGGSENGFYYVSAPADWRFYQARGGGLTLSVPSGHSFVKATFTYNNKNGGVLIAPDGTTQVNTGAEFAFSGSSAMFTVSSTTGATNGQARIYKISVEYK